MKPVFFHVEDSVNQTLCVAVHVGQNGRAMLDTINGELTYLDPAGFGFHRKQNIEAILAAQDGLCFFCTSVLQDEDGHVKFDVDHLQPLCNEGTDWPDNLALTCPPCNSEKHWRTERQYWNLLKKKHGIEWVQERRARTKRIKRVGKKLTAANIEERNLALAQLLENLRDKLRSRSRSVATEPDIHIEERRMVVDQNYSRDYRTYPVVYLRHGKAHIPSGIPFGGQTSIVRWYKKNGASLVKTLKKASAETV